MDDKAQTTTEEATASVAASDVLRPGQRVLHLNETLNRKMRRKIRAAARQAMRRTVRRMKR